MRNGAVLQYALPAERAAPMVTVLDGRPHTLSFLAAINQARVKSLGVSIFGQVDDVDSTVQTATASPHFAGQGGHRPGH